jgi:hypothetical protein
LCVVFPCSKYTPCSIFCKQSTHPNLSPPTSEISRSIQFDAASEERKPDPLHSAEVLFDLLRSMSHREEAARLRAEWEDREHPVSGLYEIIRQIQRWREQRKLKREYKRIMDDGIKIMERIQHQHQHTSV